MAWTMASRSSASEWPKVQDGMPLLRVRRWAQSPRWRHRRRGSETWSARSGATTYVKPFLATMGRGKVPGVSLNGGSGPKTPTCTVAMEFLASPDGMKDGRAPAAGEIASSHRRPECRQGEVEAGGRGGNDKQVRHLQPGMHFMYVPTKAGGSGPTTVREGRPSPGHLLATPQGGKRALTPKSQGGLRGSTDGQLCLFSSNTMFEHGPQGKIWTIPVSTR